MQFFQNIFSQEIVQRLGWTLIHFIWQGMIIAILLAVVLRFMRKSSSNLRYTTAFIALAVMVISPIITIRMITVSVPAVNPVAVQANNLQITEPTKVIKVDLSQNANIKPVSPAKQPLKDRLLKTTESLLPHIVLAWFAGVFILSVWYLGGWTQLQKLRRQMVSPVCDEIKTKLTQLSKSLGINKAVDIFQSALINVPTVIGHFKPVILLPASALTGLSAQQIEAILAHELAHIKRCDYLVNILQTVVEILGFYHPAVWWVSNKIRHERENCCDDVAVQITGDNINYARALATMEEIRFAKPGLAVAAAGGNLFERIKRLLSDKNSNIEKRSWLPSAIVILLIAGLLIPMTMTLSSCDKQKIEQSGMNAKINQIDIDTATKDDVIKVFGQPEKYVWGPQILQKENLPDQYIMVFPNNFHVWMVKDQIIEFRFEGPSDYVYGDGLVVGSSIEKALSVLGQPSEIVNGGPNEFKDKVFYKDINGLKGHCYYGRLEKKIRLWFAYDKVHSIYLSCSKLDPSGSRKLKESELPEGSIIDANGHIVDKLDHPFVNDPQVLGIWQSVDYVREIENFRPSKKQWIYGNLFLKEMIFEDNSKVISKNENMPNGFPEKWTKGLVLYDNDQKTASKYIIKEIDDSQYMFFEWKSGDYTFRHQKPSYYVLKKVEDENQANTDYSSVIVKEGIGFDDVIVGDPNCTSEFLISKFGQPDKQSTAQWLNYNSKYGFDFWFNNNGLLSEIRFNPGFKGRLESGISMDSTMQDVFKIYGNPVKEENVLNLTRHFENQTLYKTLQFSKIFYNQNYLLFWFKGDKINQFVIYPKPQQTNNNHQADELTFYEVNKSVADFPDNDFSTPESAYAAVNKILGFNDVQKLAAVSLTRLGEGVIKAQLSDNPLSPEWIKTLENAQILEVMIVEDKNYAAVIAELPQEYSSEPIKEPFDLRGFNFENGKWLNHEDGRVRTIEEARAMLSADIEQTNKKVNSLENRTSSARRLSELGKRMITFSNDNNEKYPEKLEDLATADVNEADLKWLAENIVYFGNKVELTDPPNVVLAYDRTLLEQENGQGTNVLYNDLHVAFEKTDTLEKLGIKKQTKTLNAEAQRRPRIPPQPGKPPLPDPPPTPPHPMSKIEVHDNKSVADFLDNPGAETGKDDLPSSWFKACVPAEGLKMYRDTENVHSGKYSFAIANTHKYDQTVSNNWAQNIQNIPAGSAVKISAYIKTENADSVNVCIQCWGLGDTEKMLAFTSTNTLSGDNNWGLYESPPVLVPVDTVKITVRAVLTGTGKVWFDDINVNTVNLSDENKQTTSSAQIQNKNKNILDELFNFNIGAIWRISTLDDSDLIKGLTGFSQISGGKYPTSLDPNIMLAELRSLLEAKEQSGQIKYELLKGKEKKELERKIMDSFFASVYWSQVKTNNAEYYGSKITADDKDKILASYKMKNGKTQLIYGDLKTEIQQQDIKE